VICGGAVVIGGAVVTAACRVGIVGVVVTAACVGVVGDVVSGATGGGSVLAGVVGVTDGGLAGAASGAGAGGGEAPENAWLAATEQPTVRAIPPSNPAPVSWFTRRSRRSRARIGFSVTR
jgi:hypothetical protein